MPTVNSIGDIIPDVPVSAKALRLSKLIYPKDEDHIFHLSPGDFKMWLYLRDPKEALHLCSTFGISSRVVRQLKWKRWSLLTDFVWRLFHKHHS